MANIKECFTSRFGDKGVIVEADYSQLEVNVLAHITKDKQLMDDVVSGIDLHTVRASELFNVPKAKVTKEQRQLAKAFSFQLQYGAGAKSMAETNGTSQELARKFIMDYYSRYPGVKDWQDDTYAKVKARRTSTSKKSPKGIPLGQSTLVTETGRRYTFMESPVPDYMVKWSGATATNFKPTEVKNYPVQGMATGDIMPLVVGRIYREFVKTNNFEGKAFIINTVHDSIIFDIHEEALYSGICRVKEIMDSAPQLYQETFGKHFRMPLRSEVTVGPSWKDQLVSMDDLINGNNEETK